MLQKKNKNSSWFDLTMHDSKGFWSLNSEKLWDSSEDTRKSLERKNKVYRLLLESMNRKEKALTAKTPEPFEDNKQQPTHEKQPVDTQKIEERLLKSTNLTISMFDTGWVFEQLQEEFDPKGNIGIYERRFETFPPAEKRIIEETYWKTMNQFILDFARNMIASVHIRQKMLNYTQERF